MNLRMMRGWALLINGIVGLLDIVSLLTGNNALVFIIVNELLALLFIFGLPAIQELQPQTGRLGQAGLWCLGFAASIAFIVTLIFFFSTLEVNNLIPLSSAIFFLVGSVVVGWLTIRAQVFPPAVGWLLIFGGVLNLTSGLMPSGLIMTLLGISGVLAQSAALVGYGWVIIRRPLQVPDTSHLTVHQHA
jgi:hypothetical protein